MLMRSHATLIVLATACALGLASCAGPATATPGNIETVTPVSSPAVTDTSTATATATPRPTSTPLPYSTFTPAPTATPGPPPTHASVPAFGAARVGYDFLFGNQPPGCELPCWQGIVAKESNAGDVQRMFDEAFGFNGSRDFFADLQQPTEDVVHTEYYWQDIPATPTELSPGSFYIRVYVHGGTHIVEAILLEGDSERFKKYSTPQRVLRELGVPSHILVAMFAQGPWAGFSLNLIYNTDILVHYPQIVTRIERPNGISVPGVTRLCLDSLSSNAFNVGGYMVDIALAAPSTEEGRYPSILQYWLGDVDELSYELVPFEELFGLSPEEVTALAQQQNNACIQANVP